MEDKFSNKLGKRLKKQIKAEQEDKKRYNWKISLIGDKGVGKTSLANEYLGCTFKQDYTNSMGFSMFSNKREYRGNYVSLSIWELTSLETYKRITSKFYSEGTDIYFLIYDITKKSTLDYISVNSNYLCKNKILVANKKDLEKDRKISTKDGIEFAKNIGCSGYAEISVEKNHNVQKLLDFATELLIYRKDGTDRNYKQLKKIAKTKDLYYFDTKSKN